MLLGVASALSAACQTIVTGAPSWPPCYLDSEARELEADRLQETLPNTYAWVREMDALCVAWRP